MEFFHKSRYYNSSKDLKMACKNTHKKIFHKLKNHKYTIYTKAKITTELNNNLAHFTKTHRQMQHKQKLLHRCKQYQCIYLTPLAIT